MSLDATQPTDQALVSSWPSWVRLSRAAVNALEAAAVFTTGFGVTSLNVTAGTTTLVIGTDLLAISHELILMTGVGASTLVTITGGTEGQIKIIIFQDANIDLTDGLKAGGALYLNQVPILSDFEPAQDDVLTLINIGVTGDTDGYWKELYRTLSVK